MSLPSLLRHVGAHIPRGVSVDGRVLAGQAAVAAVAAGRAIRIAPHTNHGGVQGALGDATGPTGLHADAWWATDAVAQAADIAAVARAFPSFSHDGSRGGHRFKGVLDTGRGRFRVAAIGDPDGGIPHLLPIQPRALGRHDGRGFHRPEHVYTNGNLCIAGDDDWHPDRHDTATAIAWAAHWYATYTDWRLGGPWSSDGYRPDAVA